MREVKFLLFLVFLTFALSINKIYVLDLTFKGNHHIQKNEFEKLLRLKKKSFLSTTEFKSKASAFDHDLQISITRFYSGQYSYRKTISSQTTELTEWHRTIKHSFFSQLVTLQTSITNSQKFLHAQNPETILQKGYAIVSDDNRTIRSADTARQHKSLNLEFIDGKIQVINQDYDQ